MGEGFVLRDRFVIRSIASLIATVVIGLVIGLTGGFVQAHRIIWILDERYVVVPWGAVIVIVVLLVGIRGAAKFLHRRSAGWLVFLGWLAATLFLATETVAGDLAISSGLRQWVYLLAGAILGSAVATLPPRSLARSVGTVDTSGHRSGPAETPRGLDEPDHDAYHRYPGVDR